MIGLAVLGVLIVLVLLLSLLRSRKKRRASEWDWESDEASGFSETFDDRRW